MRVARSLVRALAVPFLVVPLVAQSAAVIPFGTGCGAPSQVLRMTTQGLPSLGGAVTLVYHGPNSYVVGHVTVDISHPHLLLGLSNSAGPGFVLPLTLPPALTGGVAGCSLYVSSEWTFAMPRVVFGLGPFLDRQPLVIPNDPTLIGATLFAQWVAYRMDAPAFGPVRYSFHTSDAVLLRVGT
jgi:hypothetical protein